MGIAPLAIKKAGKAAYRAPLSHSQSSTHSPSFPGGKTSTGGSLPDKGAANSRYLFSLPLCEKLAYRQFSGCFGGLCSPHCAIMAVTADINSPRVFGVPMAVFLSMQ